MTTITTSTIRRITATLFISQSFASAARIASVNIAAIGAVAIAGNNEDVTGFPMTVALLGGAFAAYPAGRFMGRFGRRLGLSAGYIAGLLGGLVVSAGVIMNSLPVFLLGWLLIGISRAISDQARYAAADIASPRSRARIISIIVSAGTVGAIFGPLTTPFSGRIAESLGYDELVGPGIFTALLFIIPLIFLNLFLRPDPKDLAQLLETEEEKVKSTKSGRSFRQVLKLPSARLALISIALAQTIMVLVMTSTPIHMTHHNHGLDAISLVFSAHIVGMYGLSIINGWLADRLGRRAVIGLGSLMLIAACILAPQSPDTLPLAASLFLLGLGWNMCFVAGSTLLTDVLATNERARIQGAADQVVMFASAFGSLSSGPLLKSIGFESLAIIAAGASLLVLAATLAIRQAGHVETTAAAS